MNKTRYPSHLIDPRSKDKKWVLQYLKAAWGEYKSFGWNSLYGARLKYGKIKNYVQGKQPIDKYKESMNISSSDNTSYLNIDWSIVPILSKFRTTAISRVNKVDHNIRATAIDLLATEEMDDYYKTQKAKITLRNELEKIQPGLSEMTPVAKQEGEPADFDELEMQRAYTHKHQMTIEMEQAVEMVLDQNNFQNIRNQVKADVFDFGVGGYKEYIDSNGAVKIRRLQPESIITSRCRNRDFSDVQHVGEVIEITIADLKQIAGNQFTDKEYMNIAENVAGRLGNDTIDTYSARYHSRYDDFKIHVLDLEFFSVNESVYKKSRDKRGNRFIKRETYNKRGETKNGRYERVAYKVVYKGSWIIGTDYVYNAGLCTDMKRAKNKLMDTTLSYHLFAPDFYDMSIVSRIEQAIPIVDSFQLAWYKLQQTIAEARPKGIQIEIGALEDISLGQSGQTLKPMDILDLYYQKGVVLYRKTDMDGNMTNYRPIDELQNGIGDEPMRLLNLMQQQIQLLRDVMGLNELTDGSTPDPRTLTTIANMASEATNNNLYPIIEADNNLLKKLAESIVIRIQDVAKNNGMKGYVRGLGENTKRFLKVSPKVSNHEYAIKLESIPDAAEKQQLIMEASKYHDSGLLEFEDVIMIKNTDNLKVAEQLLGYRMKKRKEEQHKQSLELQQANAQTQQQSAMVAEEAKQKTLQMEYELKMQLLQLEKDLEARNMEMRQAGDAMLRQADNETKLTSKIIENDSKEYLSERA